MTKRKAKTILLISDLHCGHKIGLTPPRLWSPVGQECRKVQEQVWKWYISKVKDLRPYAVILVGDMIDGTGKRSGGCEQLTPDMIEQAWMAVDCIKEIGGNPKILAVGGTEYHTGQESDFEKIVAKELKATVYGNHIYPEIEGVVFDIRHHIGNSSVPYGKSTGIEKEMTWNEIESAQGLCPLADIVVRGHTHNSRIVEKPRAGKIATGLKLPAMQAPGTQFGARKCSGIVHMGFALVTVLDGEYSIEVVTETIEATKKVAVKI